MQGLITAINTLTIIPLREIKESDFRGALSWFPFVGLILGFIFLGIDWLWSVISPGFIEVSVLLILIFQLILTGGLHIDGLADWADAVGSRKGIPERLMIMKDPHMGTFGVCAIVLDLLMKYILMRKLFELHVGFLIIHVMVISRTMMVELICTMPYARKEHGTGWPFVEAGSLGGRLISDIFSIAILLALGGGWYSMGLFLTGWFFTRILRRLYLSGFGGITGDLLGSSNEMIELLLLLVCSVSGKNYLTLSWWNPF